MFPKLCTRLQLFAALTGNPAEGIKIEGDGSILKRLTRYATAFTKTFNIIEP
jgi:predicted nuclease of restriction endonuclease-like RecB superfamily